MADLDAALRAIVRDEIAAVVRRELAPLRAAIDALAGSAAIGPVPLDGAAAALGKSVRTLRRLAAAGQLPGAKKIGASWRVDLAALRIGGSDLAP